MQVEDVTRIGLPAGRAAEQEGNLAVGPGVLGQIVIDEQRILSLVHEVLAHRATGVGRQVPERGGVARGGGDDDRVIHRPPLLERGGDLRHGGGPLADGDVDADHALALLVDDGVERDRRLAGLAIADDQLPLAASDGNHGVDRLDAGLQRRVDGLAGDHPRGDLLHRRELLGRDRPLAVDRLAQGIHDPPDQRLADRYLDDLAGSTDLIAFLDALVRAQDDGADRVFFEVEGDASYAPFEFQHLERLGGLQAIDLRDPVAYLGDNTDVGG